MKNFFLKCISVIAILFIIDYFAGVILDGLFTDLPSKSSETSIIYRSFFVDKSRTLVLGSSTANHHYNTCILRDSLGVPAFNAGIDGIDVIYSDLVLQAFLNRSELKYVLVDIGPANMNGNWKNRVSCIKQYYGRNKAITDYYDNETGWQQHLKLFSNLYRYNNTLHSIISLLLLNKGDDQMNGYRPLEGHKDFEYVTKDDFIPDPTCLRHLENMVDLCKERGVMIVLCKSPQQVIELSFNEWLCSFGEKHNIPVIMESENIFWKEHKEFFRDGYHLNSDGADIFTRSIVCNIKQI